MSSKLERTTRFQGDKKFQEQMYAERETLQKMIEERAPIRNQEQMNAIQAEKKLREICALRQRQVDGEKLEKLQADKMARKDELFREVAELKLRKAEKDLLKVFKRYVKPFQDLSEVVCSKG